MNMRWTGIIALTATALLAGFTAVREVHASRLRPHAGPQLRLLY